jgi:hypothetical protein
MRRPSTSSRVGTQQGKTKTNRHVRPVNRPTTAELLARSSEVRHVVIQACGPHGHTASPAAWPSVLRWTSIIPSTASRLMVP